MSSDILPLPGLPTTGAGLRAWSLGEGLVSRGHRVFYAMPAKAVRPEWRDLLPEEIVRLAWEDGSIRPLLDYAQPDVLLVCNWPVLAMIPDDLDLPVALDQHGPHLLERQYQGFLSLEFNIGVKLHALGRADFFTCAGNRQRLYFLAWLLQSGFDVAGDRVAAIPVSLAPDLPERLPERDLTFVYGGVFLPWQDPSLGLTLLVEELERRGQGQLLFFGGRHPVYPVNTGIFETLKQRLAGSPRIVFQDMVPHDQLLRNYSGAGAAIDLMAYNLERELAFTTRTVEYLWCGLPVLYNDYAELATWIREYDAGWTLDPQDAVAIRRTISGILDHPAILETYGCNAQRLVREQLTWERTIEPLDAFVRAANKRPRPGRAPRSVTEGGTSPGRPPDKTFGQLVDEALLHYRTDGLRGMARETLGYLQRRRRR